MNIDIHDIDSQFAHALRRLQHSTMSEHNKTLVLAYCNACRTRQVCRTLRLSRALSILTQHDSMLRKDFETVTRDDIESCVSQLLTHEPPYTAETIATHKAILRRFYTWLANPASFGTRSTPSPLVAWMTVHVRKQDKIPLQRHALLTPREIEQAVRACQSTRDRALISVLWETGARIAEIGNLRIKHIVPSHIGYTLDLTGKTGQRAPLIVSSAPAIATWLAHHPQHSPESPLWVSHQQGNHDRHLRYEAIRNIINEAFRKAGIKKRVHPHLFRHSRATYVLAHGIMNEAQAKIYFGWVPESTMLATYAHLIDTDANNAILQENNFHVTPQVQQDLRPTLCPICGTLNSTAANYCTRCATPIKNAAKPLSTNVG